LTPVQVIQRVRRIVVDVPVAVAVEAVAKK